MWASRTPWLLPTCASDPPKRSMALRSAQAVRTRDDVVRLLATVDPIGLAGRQPD
jgi:hypothetical protein